MGQKYTEKNGRFVSWNVQYCFLGLLVSEMAETIIAKDNPKCGLSHLDFPFEVVNQNVAAIKLHTYQPSLVQNPSMNHRLRVEAFGARVVDTGQGRSNHSSCCISVSYSWSISVARTGRKTTQTHRNPNCWFIALTNVFMQQFHAVAPATFWTGRG